MIIPIQSIFGQINTVNFFLTQWPEIYFQPFVFPSCVIKLTSRFTGRVSLG